MHLRQGLWFEERGSFLGDDKRLSHSEIERAFLWAQPWNLKVWIPLLRSLQRQGPCLMRGLLQRLLAITAKDVCDSWYDSDVALIR